MQIINLSFKYIYRKKSFILFIRSIKINLKLIFILTILSYPILFEITDYSY